MRAISATFSRYRSVSPGPRSPSCPTSIRGRLLRYCLPFDVAVGHAFATLLVGVCDATTNSLRLVDFPICRIVPIHRRPRPLYRYLSTRKDIYGFVRITRRAEQHTLWHGRHWTSVLQKLPIWKAIKHVCEELRGSDEIISLYSTMTRRIQAVIKSKGGNTRY